MLVCYVDFEMRNKLAALLFDDEHERHLVVKAARRARSAYRKVTIGPMPMATRCHSLPTLLKNLATVVRNRGRPMKIKKLNIG